MHNYNEFIDWVDFEKWSSVCSEVFSAKILNQSSNRMTKEKWILAGLELSNTAKNIQWVDVQDYDLIFNDWELGKVEVKTGNTPLFSSVKCLPKKIINIKLKNTYDNKNDNIELDKEFDHLMIVNLHPVFCIAFCDFTMANKYLVPLKDGFLTRIPFDELTIVYKEPSKLGVDTKINFDPKSVILGQLKKAGY
jgi:hypothetical protein